MIRIDGCDDPRMFDLNQLAHFLALAQHRHFRRAAETVHLSQSGLSRSIQTLERSLGRQLFVRRRGGVALTEHGEILAEHAENILRERQRLRLRLENAGDSTAEDLRIGLGAFVAELSGVEASAVLIGPDGHLRCWMTIGDYREITVDLIGHRIDLGFCDLTVARHDPRITCIPASRHQIFAYTRPGHPLLGQRPIDPASLFGYPIVAVRAPLRMSIDASAGRHHFDELTGELLPALDTANPSLAVKLLRNSDAVGYAALPMIESQLAEGLVAVVPLRLPNLVLESGFIHLCDHPPNELALRYVEEVRRIETQLTRRTVRLEERYGLAPA